MFCLFCYQPLKTFIKKNYLLQDLYNFIITEFYNDELINVNMQSNITPLTVTSPTLTHAKRIHDI